MIERQQSGIDFIKGASEESVNKNRVLEVGDVWKMDLADGTSIELPPRLGKVIHLGLKILSTHVSRHGPFFHINLKDRDFPERRLQDFDCHKFVALGLGLIDLKDLKGANGTVLPELFSDSDFIPILNVDEFNEAARDKLVDEHIGVAQIKDGLGRLQHSLFFFIGDHEVYVIEKSGREGALLFSSANNLIPPSIADYGSKIAFSTYEAVSSK